uniref:Lipoprotein n=1 Tax=Meiothermus ruber TaxID=277 RepID=A0A7C3DCR7_MEIRU
MSRYLRQLAGLALMGLLAACGASSQTSGNFSQSDALALAEAAQGDLQLTGAMLGDASSTAFSAQGQADSLEANAQAWGLPRRNVLILRAVGIMYLPLASSANCSINTTPSTPTDTDNDGVPASATTTYNCSYTGPGNTSYSLKGSIALQDTNDNQPYSGYSVAFDRFASRLAGNNFAIERTLQGSYSIDKQDATLFKITKNYTHTVTKTVFNNTYTGSLAFNVSKTYAPDNDGNSDPWDAGTFTVDKASPGSATWTRNNNTRNLIWYTDPTLHWNRTVCQNPLGRLMNFDSGAKEFVYINPAGEKSTLRIEFSGCGQFSVTLNGQPVE